MVEFFLPYQFLSNFLVWESFLALAPKEYQLFQKWYKKEVRYLFGKKKFYRMKDFEDMEKANKLPNIYQEPYYQSVEERLEGEGGPEGEGSLFP